MKINCPHCSKEIEFSVKGPFNQQNENNINPIQQSHQPQQTPIISRGAPIQNNSSVYYQDHNTGQVFAKSPSLLNDFQQNQVQHEEAAQSQLSLSNGISKIAQESAKTNVVNNPHAVDSDAVRNIAFGTPKQATQDQKQKEAENILSRLASSDIKR